MPRPEVADAVRATCESILNAHGVELVTFSLGGESMGQMLRLTVDRVERAVSLDEIVEISEEISKTLDAEDPIPGRYTLEVSSPGIERPLRTPAHFRRCVGGTVAVKTRPGTAGERRMEGTLEAADEKGVTIAGRAIAYADIERAHTVFRWGGSDKRSTKKAASR